MPEVYTEPFIATTNTVIASSDCNAGYRGNIRYFRQFLTNPSAAGLALVSTSADGAGFTQLLASHLSAQSQASRVVRTNAGGSAVELGQLASAMFPAGVINSESLLAGSILTGNAGGSAIGTGVIHPNRLVPDAFDSAQVGAAFASNSFDASNVGDLFAPDAFSTTQVEKAFATGAFNAANALDIFAAGSIVRAIVEAVLRPPVGMVVLYAGPAEAAVAALGWKFCTGQAVSRTTFATLFALIGTTYGAGDGTTTFNLPDWRDRVPIGAGSTYALAATGGAAAYDLSHTHGVSGTTGIASAETNNLRTVSPEEADAATKDHTHTYSTTSGSGGSASQSVLNPYLAAHYMIYTGVAS